LARSKVLRDSVESLAVVRAKHTANLSLFCEVYFNIFDAMVLSAKFQRWCSDMADFYVFIET